MKLRVIVAWILSMVLVAGCSASGDRGQSHLTEPVCGPSAHPSPGCTGVPKGVALTDAPLDKDGNYVAADRSVPISGLHIAGNLLVKADGVEIRNSQIDGTVLNDFAGVAHSYTISDSTVGPATGCIGQPGLNDANYVATRVAVRGHDDGFRVSPPGNVVVRDSYARLCFRPPSIEPPDGSHSDGIQAYCPDAPCKDLEFAHNTVDARGIPATFMVNLVDRNLSGRVVVSDNLLGGGAYTIVTEWRAGPNWTIRNNNVIDRSWAYGPMSAEGTCARQDWSGNTLVAVDDQYLVTSVVGTLGCVG